VQCKMGGKFHLKLNIGESLTDCNLLHFSQ
jgi:hypothetical protein